VAQGEYHRHKHDEDDEFFFVLKDEFFVDLPDRAVSLKRRSGFLVPRGSRISDPCLKCAVVLMVENAGVIPTGD